MNAARILEIATAVALALGALGGRATRAVAGTPAEALARHADADVAALRAQLPGDAVVRCTLGAVYGKRGDLPRAQLYLVDCGDAALPDGIASEIARTAQDVKKRLRESQLSELQIVTRPSGLTAEVDALPGEALLTPASVWVKAGTHTVRATSAGTTFTNTVTTQPYSRSTVYLDLGASSVTPVTKDGKVDFTEDNALEKHDGSPPPVKRRSMMSDRQLGVVKPSSGDELVDPLATPPPPARLPLWLGVRIGGGVFDDAVATARLRPALALAARYVFDGPAFASARLDWTRRGGASGAAEIDSLGASVGAGYTLIDRQQLALAAIAQLRGDLRFADAMDVSPAGLSVAASLELAFPATPLTAGLRFEQGITELVSGARDRALLVELGLDWR